LGAPGKIRIMLALLCASLFITAIIAQNTYTPVNNLFQTGKTLEQNLQKKERAVNNAINKSSTFNQLKSLQDHPDTALKFIQYFTTDRSTWFITLKKDSLLFWSGVKVIPENTQIIKEGYSFQQEANGYYEVIRKNEGDFSAIFFIPVKLNYQIQNQFLKNTFATDLLKDDNIEIADFTDKSFYSVHAVNGQYLFSVKLKNKVINLTYYRYEWALWLLTLLSFCILLNNICGYFASKGYVILSFVILATFIVAIRFANLHFDWPDITHNLKLFDSKLYGSSKLYPSLGDLCLNVLFMCWFMVFMYSQRKRILKRTLGKWISYPIFICFVAILIVVSTSFVNLFYGLVINSTITFDVSNVLNLSFYSLLGILMLCFAFLIFFLLVEVLLTINTKLSVPNPQKAIIFIIAIVASTVVNAYYDQFSLFYLLWAGLVFYRAYAYSAKGGVLDSASVAMIILVCALISSIKLSYFESVKEKDTRKKFIQKLEAPDDLNADDNFKSIESQITADTSLIQYFNDSKHSANYTKTRLQKVYFNGYLSRYNIDIYEYNKDDKAISDDNSYDLSVFKDEVLYSAQKVSAHFYRENDAFGVLSYFAIIPLMQKGEKKGTIVIELKSKPLQTAASFPGLWIDGESNTDNLYRDYSYAFYTDDKLVSQNGNFVYDLENTRLKGQPGQYTFKNTHYNGDLWYMRFTSYSHLIYKTSPRNLIVVSKEDRPLFFTVASLTFFFVLFLLFTVAVVTMRWLWLRIKILTIKNNRLRWSFKVNFDMVLYKTRIQFSMVFAVVVTLILVGVITFFSISTEYQTQQDKTIRDKINKITSAFEGTKYSRYLANVSEEAQVNFDDFANTYSADLSLFDLKGRLLVTTQPKIYEDGLQAPRMNGRAFVKLANQKLSEYANDEKIALLSYKAAFMPVRNNNSETIAYIELPYFANESDYRERVGSLLNIMINVYAVVFIAIGLFAVFIARQITSPLSFIQYSLSKTMYGKKNEPIKWDRDDEIGALVKEYNKMIAALENSAQKLAQSERESAWREMAKQVAHEIKNPLTPLKLGLQLLDKSWRDKDPKFDQKFERFSKSFVEQIESLSSIASEFSAFAKMPETRLSQLNVFDILNQAVTIFKEMDNIKINYTAPDAQFFINADRDQLLRCFNNLLKNAIEATLPNKLGVIEINHLVTSKNVLLTIKDNGEGIPENLREKIFEPNFTTKSSGTGLGLAFVKNSIENAGGKIWFETVIGEGTTFYISLPTV